MWAEKTVKLVRIMYKFRAHFLSKSVRISHVNKGHGYRHLFWLFKRFDPVFWFLSIFQRISVVKYNVIM